jgi:DNA-binding transcriptional MerR regulator
MYHRRCNIKHVFMAAPAHHPTAPDPLSDELTIDELARATGTTVRNVRFYQSRGLLPPPEIRARTGYYRPEHVARLRAVQAMRAQGFRLDAIQRLLSGPESAAEQIFEFGRALLSSFGEIPPEFATTAELEQRLGGPLDPSLVRKAEKLALLRHLGDDRWEILNPTLISAGEQLVALGIPLSHAIAVAEQIERHTRAIAKAYVRLFLSDVMGQSSISDRAPEDWQRLGEALERLRPLAMEAIRASFEQAMSDLVERHLQRYTHRP